MEIISQLLPFVFLIAIMYFVIIRPQQKEAKARKEMIDALQKGDKVITAGGIIVTVYKVEEQFLSVKINEDTTVKITKDSVIRKYEDEA
ncbi:MAG: preprotein translocase subunit YajC [Sulfurimonas sp. RIFCSPHIGHO2_12_FULL_36_9]|jgi:preprotein translocase subunit YajC|uniref:preprotein translocase subunit YajC n=1 Tax=Sulfurimonas sp. RIFCSPLOWO2_12_36_12 TaxID=1802253 RepID=UPI0008B63865|nr:preprotein translocase subunit YajC [Sulfurimonas sp. RIFCSPLOWO2_12_36_12]OHD96482.1 MAG: preprotein translocase subunit YajC [Sulfurimonas sp. RIFCSPHIGHO2_12_FULL_36_9]OHD99491.1 MAG: preprotein translocase subunit YajC [Sulfurimonas sp. RIFCSPLOWO2_02_FULL_36_28]OHE00406.1 MAG: preprotein translocase subunit YajC [Sulfurimonas sp. RIFCSPLOWO2_12_36_12]OHE07454.1 MAG: preprotein translocase subunit YajC [Sulfurimonas sp. RIFCSPLOWO2_12_FULL_36_74]